MKLQLINKTEIPLLGFGTFRIPDTEVESVVLTALDVGYRHIDTAAIYENEAGVGRAIANSKLNRDELFITTKLWVEEQTKKDVHKAFELSLKKLNIDYIDLYLIHWPSKGLIEQWQALEELYLAGKIKAIGASNFHKHHFERYFPMQKLNRW